MLAGFCYVDELKKQSHYHPELPNDLPTAISIGFPLSKAILNTLEELPNRLYQNHYRAVNAFLESQSLLLAHKIQMSGFKALPVPVSLSISPLQGHLSHRMVAMLSGLGWIGKSALLVTPQFGAQMRLVTILTDMPVESSAPMTDFACDDCADCLKVCPVKAISDHPKNFKRNICYRYLNTFKERGIVEDLICGLCVQVCPGGKQR
jgi:epoxyqueuosine reductase QueG